MVKDAERYAVEDKKKKDFVEVKNSADSMIYSTEKSINEHRAKLPQDVIDAVERESKALKELISTENPDPAAVKSQVEKLAQASFKIGEAVNKAGQAAGASGGASGGSSGSTNGTGGEGQKGNTVDAEFTEDKKK